MARMLMCLVAAVVLASVVTFVGAPNDRGDASEPQPMIWGDGDCDGEPTRRDKQVGIRYLLEQAALSQTEPCPDPGTMVFLSSPYNGAHPFLDWLCDGSVDVIDLLALDRHIKGLSAIVAESPCPSLGSSVNADPIHSTLPDAVGVASIPNGRELSFDIVVETSTDIGALHLKADFDPNDLQYVVCAQLPEVSCASDSPAGKFAAVGVDANGLTQELTLRVQAFVANDVALDVDVLFLTDTEGRPLETEVSVVPPVLRMYQRGDGDCNGGVNTDDILPILSGVAGFEPFDCTDLGERDEFAHPQDTDCDGDLTALDALPILHYLSGLPTGTSECEPVGT